MLIILTISFLIFLYNLYYFSKEDFLIVRKGISLEKILNAAFITSFIALFFARFFHVLFNPKPYFLNIVGFIDFPYLPGLSVLGGMISALVFLAIYCRHKKYPIGKFLDLFTLSFIAVMPIGFLMNFIFSFAKTDYIFNLLFIFVIILSLIFIKIVYKLTEKGEIKDGSFSLIYLAIFSLIYFLIKLFVDIKNFSFNIENITLFFTIFASLILLVNHEIMNKILDKK